MFYEEKLWICADSLTFYNILDKISNDYIHENSDFGSHAESSICSWKPENIWKYKMRLDQK